MFLRSSLDVASVSLLANPQLETPLLQRTTAPSSPAGCPGKGLPRDTIDGGSKVVYANQDRGKKTRPNFSRKEKPSPARERFHVRRKHNATGGALFYWTTRHTLCQPSLGRENLVKFFRQGKTLPSTPSAPQTRLDPKICPPPASRPPT